MDECFRILEVLRKLDTRWLFPIGGNDTATTALGIRRAAESDGYELACLHCPKTVDNDIEVTDHSPGFGSAARFVILSAVGDNFDLRSLPGVKLNVIMGRDAGFLTASSALARQHEEDGPHLLGLPERPVTIEQFCDDVARLYGRLGCCTVSVSEGLVDAESGRRFAEIIKEIETDEFGNPLLSGSGALGDWLASCLRKRLGKDVRVRADTLGYLTRSMPAVISEVDAIEARTCGRYAVELALDGQDAGSIVMIRQSGEPYHIEYDFTALENVAGAVKRMPEEFIEESGTWITADFCRYLRPLVGPLPEFGGRL